MGYFRSAIRNDFPAYKAPTAAIHVSIADWAIFILLHLGIDPVRKLNLSRHTLSTLHAPPDSAKWRKGSSVIIHYFQPTQDLLELRERTMMIEKQLTKAGQP
jgi:hypothetical protein